MNATVAGEEFAIEESIGEGTEGIVYAVRMKNGGRNALKQVGDWRPDVLSDITALRRCKHPYIISFLGVSHNTSSVSTLGILLPRGDKNLMELLTLDLYGHRVPSDLMPKRKLRNFFRRSGSRIMSPSDHLKERIDRYIHQIVAAVCWLNHQGIVHRDLKPDNFIYFLDTDEVRLSDFGLSTMIGHEAANIENSNIYTIMYRPPEALLEACAYYGLETEMWALGCILYEMMTGNVLFLGDTVAKILYQQSEIEDLSRLARNCHNRRYLAPSSPTPPGFAQFVRKDTSSPGYSDSLADLISQMLRPKPSKRIQYWEVMTHPFFTYSEKEVEIIREESTPNECLDLYLRPIELHLSKVAISTRQRVIQFFAEYCESRGLKSRTLYYAIEVLDLCLSVDCLTMNWYYEMIYLAETLNESAYVGLDEFILHVHPLKEEALLGILKILDWNTYITTPFDYLSNMICSLALEEDHLSMGPLAISKLDFVHELLLRGLLDPECRKMNARNLADQIEELFLRKMM